MSQEIIYTSAPQGLRPGSFGFCTVATTPGMTSTLAERLEAISGYRHVYSPGDVKEHLNPVVHSHLIFRVAGKPQHILSRIANAGFDYSQRTNKLAHHVVLDASELVGPGPAWVLAQPGFSETTWSGAPRLLPKGRACPRGESELRVCTAWQKATGDAGWAGVLAQQTLRGGKTAYLIFPEGMDVLPLLQEALALLPAARRWDVTFSTFFTRLPQGVECAWRCVLANSTEAIAAVSKQDGLIIELGRTLGPAPDNDLVLAARSGKSNIPQPKAAAKPPPTSAAPPNLADGDDFLEEFADLAEDADLKLAPPEFKGKGKGNAKPVSRGSGPPKLPVQASRGKRVAIIAGLIAFTVVLVAGVGAFVVFKDRLIVAKKPESAEVNKEMPDKEKKPLGQEDKVNSEKPAVPAGETKPEDVNDPAKESTPPGGKDDGKSTKKGEDKQPPKDPPNSEPKQNKTNDAPAKPGKTPLAPPVEEGDATKTPEGTPPQAPSAGPAGARPAPLAPGSETAALTNADMGSNPPPPKSEPASKASAWKWPVEPVFPLEPAMKDGQINGNSRILLEDKLLESGEIKSLELVGAKGKQGTRQKSPFVLEQVPQKPSWTLQYRPPGSMLKSFDVATIARDDRGLGIQWEPGFVISYGSVLPDLAECALLCEQQSNAKTVVPFSFTRVEAVRFANKWRSNSFYLAINDAKEILIADIDFAQTQSEWSLKNSTADAVTFRSTWDNLIESRIYVARESKEKTQLAWRLSIDGKSANSEDARAFHDEIPGLVKEYDDLLPKIDGVKLELEKIKSNIGWQLNVAAVNRVAYLDNEMRRYADRHKAIKKSLGERKLDESTSRPVIKAVNAQPSWPGTLSCFIVRRVKHTTKDNVTLDIDIPLVQVGGELPP